MLVIKPSDCIDCGVCVPECPIGAIKMESEELIDWIERAKTFSTQWPNITIKKPPLMEADMYKDEIGKFEKYIEQIQPNIPT
jgi:ferredoxin